MDKINTSQGKFENPDYTKDGSPRAIVELQGLETLWINTGTLCNLACVNCYIESSPKNDALVYISHEEVLSYLQEIRDENIHVKEIGITGGEPFMNPGILKIMESILEDGFSLLMLSNAMRPMMRHQDALLELRDRFTGQLSIRVSTDHYTKELHETERGVKSWQPMLLGLKWLSDNNFDVRVAGRTFSHENEHILRNGYQKFFDENNIKVDASNPHSLILFPEMNEKEDATEITTSCWGILDIDPSTLMCASSRMIVKHKGAEHPAIMACTLLAYDPQFNMGKTLKSAKTKVSLNHPHCSTFCVLGGASCSN